jgi:hypothetical protein
MSSINTSFIIITVEFLLVFGGLIVYLFYSKTRTSKKNYAVAADLVSKIKTNETVRRKSIRKIFTNNYGISEGEAAKKVDEFVAREKAFYKMLIAVYLKNDRDQLMKITDAFESVIVPCLQLMPEDYVDTKTVEEIKTQASNLKDENTELHEELVESNKILDELIQEYSAAFNKEGGTANINDNSIKISEEKLKKMEALKAKQNEHQKTQQTENSAESAEEKELEIN